MHISALWWGHLYTYGEAALQKLFFKTAEYSINKKNSIVVGARAALRIHF